MSRLKKSDKAKLERRIAAAALILHRLLWDYTQYVDPDELMKMGPDEAPIAPWLQLKPRKKKEPTNE